MADGKPEGDAGTVIAAPSPTRSGGEGSSAGPDRASGRSPDRPGDRVKIYYLNDQGIWDLHGTGIVRLESLCVRSETRPVPLVILPLDGSGPPLRHRPDRSCGYSLRRNAVITWTDSWAGKDIALSFQDPRYCRRVWRYLAAATGTLEGDDAKGAGAQDTSPHAKRPSSAEEDEEDAAAKRARTACAEALATAGGGDGDGDSSDGGGGGGGDAGAPDAETNHAAAEAVLGCNAEPIDSGAPPGAEREASASASTSGRRWHSSSSSSCSSSSSEDEDEDEDEERDEDDGDAEAGALAGVRPPGGAPGQGRGGRGARRGGVDDGEDGDGSSDPYGGSPSASPGALSASPERLSDPLPCPQLPPPSLESAAALAKILESAFPTDRRVVAEMLLESEWAKRLPALLHDAEAAGDAAALRALHDVVLGALRLGDSTVVEELFDGAESARAALGALEYDSGSDSDEDQGTERRAGGQGEGAAAERRAGGDGGSGATERHGRGGEGGQGTERRGEGPRGGDDEGSHGGEVASGGAERRNGGRGDGGGGEGLESRGGEPGTARGAEERVADASASDRPGSSSLLAPPRSSPPASPRPVPHAHYRSELDDSRRRLGALPGLDTALGRRIEASRCLARARDALAGRPVLDDAASAALGSVAAFAGTEALGSLAEDHEFFPKILRGALKDSSPEGPRRRLYAVSAVREAASMVRQLAMPVRTELINVLSQAGGCQLLSAALRDALADNARRLLGDATFEAAVSRRREKRHAAHDDRPRGPGAETKGGREDAGDEAAAKGGRADAGDEAAAKGGRADAGDEAAAKGGREDADSEACARGGQASTSGETASKDDQDPAGTNATGKGAETPAGATVAPKDAEPPAGAEPSPGARGVNRPGGTHARRGRHDEALVRPRPLPRTALTLVLDAMSTFAAHDYGEFRRFLSSTRSGRLSLTSLVDAVAWPSPGGAQEIAAELLRSLLDPDTFCDFNSGDIFLTFFYDTQIDRLLAVVDAAVAAGARAERLAVEAGLRPKPATPGSAGAGAADTGAPPPTGAPEASRSATAFSAASLGSPSGASAGRSAAPATTAATATADPSAASSSPPTSPATSADAAPASAPGAAPPTPAASALRSPGLPPLPPPPPSSVLLVLELLRTCLVRHSFRAKYCVLRKGLMERVAALLERPEATIAAAATRLLRACLETRDALYQWCFGRATVAGRIVDACERAWRRDSLLSASLCELLLFVWKTDMTGPIKALAAAPAARRVAAGNDPAGAMAKILERARKLLDGDTEGGWDRWGARGDLGQGRAPEASSDPWAACEDAASNAPSRPLRIRPTPVVRVESRPAPAPAAEVRAAPDDEPESPSGPRRSVSEFSSPPSSPLGRIGPIAPILGRRPATPDGGRRVPPRAPAVRRELSDAEREEAYFSSAGEDSDEDDVPSANAAAPTDDHAPTVAPPALSSPPLAPFLPRPRWAREDGAGPSGGGGGGGGDDDDDGLVRAPLRRRRPNI